MARTLLIGLFVALGAGCGPDGAPPDAGADAALDGGTDGGRDAGPRLVPRPPRPRAPDGGCPPAPDRGVATLYDLDVRSLEIGDVRPADGDGVWVVGRAQIPARLLVVRLDADGLPRFARTFELPAPQLPRAASTPSGGLVVATGSEDAIIAIALDSDGAPVWTRALDPLDGVFRDPPLVTADANGVVIAASIRRGSSTPNGVHLAFLDPDGAVLAERRMWGTRTTTFASAVAASAERVLVVARTDAFTTRTRLRAGAIAPATSPWVLSFERDGELDWQRAFDAPIGNDLGLEQIERHPGGWLLGGATEVGLGDPWVVELTDEGRVRSVTRLSGIPNVRVIGIDDTGLDVRLLQASPDYLFSGDAGGAVLDVTALDMQAGRAIHVTNGLAYAGPPPGCNDARVPPSHPALCGDSRRELMHLRFPNDRLSPCMRGLFVDPFASQEREQPLSLDLAVTRTPERFESPSRALELSGAELEITPIRLCLSSPRCIRAFALP